MRGYIPFVLNGIAARALPTRYYRAGCADQDYFIGFEHDRDD
jgi:hypothetical protein